MNTFFVHENSSIERYAEKSLHLGKEIGDTEKPKLADAEPWPILLEDALHGLAGNIVKAVDPYTEADPVAVLITVLTLFGNIIGATAHFRVERSRHFLRLFSALVGRSSKGRKGQSMSTPRYMFEQVDPVWLKDRLKSGLSSGEGLIYNVRDSIHKNMPVKEHGLIVTYQDELIDAGESDKRLMIVEEELAQSLKVMTREGNTLSPIIRQAWDNVKITPLVRNNPMTATGAHISIIGHITHGELSRHLTETEQSNGFANRFLWLLVKRSKIIPRPTGIPDEQIVPLIGQLRESVNFAKEVMEMDRDHKAEEMWEAVYPHLSDERHGLFGAVTARAEAQVMRLACIYALLDHSAVVRVIHLRAGLALWEYAEESARLIFGNSLGNSMADDIFSALKNNPEGLTRTEIRDLFSRNRKAGDIDRALGVLLRAGLAHKKNDEKDDYTRGRPEERWSVSMTKSARAF